MPSAANAAGIVLGARAMADAILVINAGSSSIKFSLFDTRGETLAPGAYGQVEGIGTAPRLLVSGLPDGSRLERSQDTAAVPDHAGAIRVIHQWLVEHHTGERTLAAVGHRVVHGGVAFDRPMHLDDRVLAELDRLVPLAPLHQPHALAAIRAVSVAAPDVAQYACFDTAFHRSQSLVAQLFALPRDLTEAGVRRYGFHGISYEYIASTLPHVAPEIANGRVVVAHLGNGASMCAMRGGRSVASTMGFTALDGLPMGTRCGALDAGVVLYLLQQRGLNPAEVEDLLYHRSGLLGVSGVSSDMRAVLASDLASARQAVELFVYRIVRELGSLAAALGGLDGLVFTAGIGEHAAPVRAAVLRQARWLGLELDEAANQAGGPRISLLGSAVSAWVVPTDENLMIARAVRRLHARV
jgi:acetate kinase